MKNRALVAGVLCAFGIWYAAGVSAVFGQVATVAPPAATATAAAADAPRPGPPSASAAPQPGEASEADEDMPPRDVRDKLTGPQLYEILKARSAASDPPAVAIVVPVAVFLMAFAIVAVGMYTAFRRDRLRHETLRLLIERGGQIPPELLGPPHKRHSDLRRGIVLTSGGIALAIVLAATVHEHGVWTAGLIPLLLGLGYLLVWKLEPKSATDPGRDAGSDYRSSAT